MTGFSKLPVGGVAEDLIAVERVNTSARRNFGDCVQLMSLELSAEADVGAMKEDAADLRVEQAKDQ